MPEYPENQFLSFYWNVKLVTANLVIKYFFQVLLGNFHLSLVTAVNEVLANVQFQYYRYLLFQQLGKPLD